VEPRKEENVSLHCTLRFSQ